MLLSAVLVMVGAAGCINSYRHDEFERISIIDNLHDLSMLFDNVSFASLSINKIELRESRLFVFAEGNEDSVQFVEMNITNGLQEVRYFLEELSVQEAAVQKNWINKRII